MLSSGDVVEAWKTTFRSRWYGGGPLLVGYYTGANEEGVHDHLVHIKWDDGDITHDSTSSEYVLSWYKMGMARPKTDKEEIERIKNMEVADHWDHRVKRPEPKKRASSDHGKRPEPKKRKSS